MIFHFKFQNNHENQSFEKNTGIHNKMVKSIRKSSISLSIQSNHYSLKS